MSWQPDELQRMIEADDLHIAPFRPDGTTPGTLTWIWAVQVDGEMYVRAYSGRASRWYQAASAQRAGRIRAAGHDHDVTFTPVDGSVDDAIDEAYRTKYSGSPFLPPMINGPARAATVRIELATPSDGRPAHVSDR